MRSAALHARARGLPVAAALAVAITLLAWAGAEALADSPRFGVAHRWPVALAAPLLLAVLAGPTLTGADPELEASTAVRWRRWRLLQALGTLAVSAILLASIGLREPTTYGASELVRNIGGLLGLVLLTAVVLGARLAWVLAGGYAVLAYLHGPPGQDQDPVWVWAVRRGTDEQSYVLSGALLALGVAAYAVSGARRDVPE